MAIMRAKVLWQLCAQRTAPCANLLHFVRNAQMAILNQINFAETVRRDIFLTNRLEFVLNAFMTVIPVMVTTNASNVGQMISEHC